MLQGAASLPKVEPRTEYSTVAEEAELTPAARRVQRELALAGMLLEDLDELRHLGMDGFIRCATYLLRQQGVGHRVYAGRADVPDGEGGVQCVQPHYWLHIHGHIFDYRLHQHLPIGPVAHGQVPVVQLVATVGGRSGTWRAPHGVLYQGQQVQVSCGEAMYRLLVQPAAE